MHANSIHRATVCSSCCMLLPPGCNAACLRGGNSGHFPDYLSLGTWSYWSCVLVANSTLLLHAQARQCLSFTQLFVNFKHLQTISNIINPLATLALVALACRPAELSVEHLTGKWRVHCRFSKGIGDEKGASGAAKVVLVKWAFKRSSCLAWFCN